MYTDDKSLFYAYGAGINLLEKIPEGSGYLFVFKVAGEMKVTFGSNERTLTAGKATVLSLERRRAVTDSGSTAYFVARGSLCESLMQIYGIGDGFTVNAPEVAEHFFSTCRALSVGAVAEQVFLFHNVLRGLSAAVGASGKADTPLLIKEYLDAHAREKVTLDKVAELFFLSKSQIFRIFKARYGISPMQYYMDKKTAIAKEMLISTDMRIADIAEALAFSDAKHLTKTFKNATGMLPKSYRREHKSTHKVE